MLCAPLGGGRLEAEAGRCSKDLSPDAMPCQKRGSSSTVVPLTPFPPGGYPPLGQLGLAGSVRGQKPLDWRRHGGVYRLDTNPSNWPCKGARPPILPPRKSLTRRVDEQVASGGCASLDCPSRCDGAAQLGVRRSCGAGCRSKRLRPGASYAVDERLRPGSPHAVDERQRAGPTNALEQVG